MVQICFGFFVSILNILKEEKKNSILCKNYLRKLAMRNEVDDSVGVKDDEMNFGTISGKAAKVDD